MSIQGTARRAPTSIQNRQWAVAPAADFNIEPLPEFAREIPHLRLSGGFHPAERDYSPWTPLPSLPEANKLAVAAVTRLIGPVHGDALNARAEAARASWYRAVFTLATERSMSWAASESGQRNELPGG